MHGVPVVVISQGRVCVQNGKVCTCTCSAHHVYMHVQVYMIGGKLNIIILCNDVYVGGGCERLWEVHSSSAIL